MPIAKRTSVWYRYKDQPAECLESRIPLHEANKLAGEYTLAYATAIRAGEAKLWVGRRKDEPSW